MMEDLKKRNPSLFNDPSDPNKFRRNLLKVQVYFEEMNDEFLTEIPTYQVLESNYTFIAIYYLETRKIVTIHINGYLN